MLGVLTAGVAAAGERVWGLYLMRVTEFWSRMEAALGPTYHRIWADQFVITGLGGRTVNEALASGEQPKFVWRAVWAVLELPPSER